MLAAKPMIIPFVNISSPTLARSSLPNIFVYQTWVFWYYTRKNHTNILYNVHISINISIKIWDSYI
jgi:CDP-diacylglycerol pyrophosphatase